MTTRPIVLFLSVLASGCATSPDQARALPDVALCARAAELALYPAHSIGTQSSLAALGAEIDRRHVDCGRYSSDRTIVTVQ